MSIRKLTSAEIAQLQAQGCSASDWSEIEVAQAFEATHNIKGFLANMGLTPMYDIAIRIMEPLRKGTVTGHEENYKALMAAKEKLAKIMGK